MSENSEAEQFRKLFVFGLKYDTTEEALKSHFEQWGEVVDCVVMRKVKNSDKSRGFGFLTFKRAHMIDDVQAARPHRIDGRDVKSKRAVPRENSNKPEALVTVNKLYVAGIKDDLSEDDLRDCFGSYGNILSINIVVDKNTGKRRGIAFLEFDDHDPVDKICLHQHNYKGRRLEVKKALTRDEMNKIKMKKEMQSYDRGEWRGVDEFDRGGYGRGESYGGGRYESEYGAEYSSRYGGSSSRYDSGYGGSSRYDSGYGDGYSIHGQYGNGDGYRDGDRYGYDREYNSGGGYDEAGFRNSASIWSDDYSDGYYGGEGREWDNFSSSYGGPIRGNSSYSQRSQGPYGGGRGSGGYGRR